MTEEMEKLREERFIARRDQLAHLAAIIHAGRVASGTFKMQPPAIQAEQCVILAENILQAAATAALV